MYRWADREDVIERMILSPNLLMKGSKKNSTAECLRFEALSEGEPLPRGRVFYALKKGTESCVYCPEGFAMLTARNSMAVSVMPPRVLQNEVPSATSMVRVATTRRSCSGLKVPLGGDGLRASDATYPTPRA